MRQKMEKGAPGILADAMQQSHQYSAQVVCSSTRDQDLWFILGRAERQQNGNPFLPILLPMTAAHLGPCLCLPTPTRRGNTPRREKVGIEHAGINNIPIWQQVH